jgi:hypothetical protein
VPHGLLAPGPGRRDELGVRHHLPEQRGRVAVGGLLDVASLVARDLEQEPAGDDRARLLLRDVLRAGVLVPMLDQEPRGPLLAPAPRADQDPGAVELLAVQGELELALLQGGVHVVDLRSPGAPVPDHHRAAAVLPLRDDSLERVVLDGVVLHLHREALDGRVEGRPLGDGPGEHDAVPFEAKVVVERRRPVLLDHEGELLAPLLRGGLAAFGLRRHAETAFLAIFLESHVDRPPRHR